MRAVFAVSVLCVAVVGVVPSPPAAARPAAPTGWIKSVIGKAGDYATLALDSGGDAHACWLVGEELKYATGAWVSRTVDRPGAGFGATYSSAIAVDHADAMMFHSGDATPTSRRPVLRVGYRVP